ncbi:hypothetical protein CEUSTIGMA_g22.t1 [Chlamydomonas eustigma]|uniref:NB-ARC domain-containing protein n=1 Tax=Chlamydomonas eustigma TaxID=1157962 RepID=A0A250WPE9_9CHLO|nr:hypothetical protein CEUSTIGMA_g22.t1 [Chlamydomonas eustigma]|eukprot:GAX72566.1 hypothetical protein CEUSTIGMA_g22.t1 [Chlamydomonas eustigma]
MAQFVRSLTKNFEQGRIAVKIRWLEEFSARIDQTLCTFEIVTKIVLPETAHLSCRYIDVLDPKDLGTPDYFISHRWGANFQTLITAIKHHFEDMEMQGKNYKELFVWLDIFAINQHPSQEQVDDLARLQDVIRMSHSTLLVMDNTGQVLRRVWCLFEIWKTVQFKGVQNLVVLAKDVDLLGLKDIFLQLNCADAQATVEADRQQIINDIKTTTGIEAMNRFIRQALVDSAKHEARKMEAMKEKNAMAYFQALDKAGQMLTLAGMYDEAEPLIKKSLNLCVRMVGEKHIQVASCHNNMAGLYLNQGKLENAEPHQRTAVKISEEIDPLNSKTVIFISNLAQVTLGQGDFAEAEALLRKALNLCLQLKTKAGITKDDMELASLLNSLASVYVQTKRPSRALPLYERALKAAQANLEPQDPELSLYMGNMASVLQDLQRFEEAEQLQRKALDLCQRRLGFEHPMTACVSGNLGTMLGERGQYEEAEKLVREALEVRRRVLGAKHPGTLSSAKALAGILVEGQKFTEAEPLLKLVLEESERTLGPDHASTLKCVEVLAGVLASLGKMEAPIEMYSRLQTAREKELGLSHPDTMSAIGHLALLYFYSGQYYKSAQYFQRVITYQKNQGSHVLPDLLVSLINLTAVLSKDGKYTEALACIDEAISCAEMAGGQLASNIPAYERIKAALMTYLEPPAVAKPTLPAALAATATDLKVVASGSPVSTSIRSPIPESPGFSVAEMVLKTLHEQD